MKYKLINKLIATSIITSSILSICPAPVSAIAVSSSWAGQTAGKWVQYNDNWYYYVGGQLQKGWIYDVTGWYYADNNGVMQTGVISIGDNTYVFADSGVMQTGNIVINGVLYTADSDGVIRGDNTPVPVKAFDWTGTDDNVKHPSLMVDSSKDNTDASKPLVVYDPLAPKEKFEVTFKDDDGEEFKTRVIKDGDTIRLYEPTKKGYSFVEWNTKKSGNGESYEADEEIEVTENITLYAVWEEVEVTDDNAEELGVVKVEDITITSDNDKQEITTDGGTLRFRANVLPVDATKDDVKWSVEAGTGKATIDDNGVLTADENGTVYVKATAEDGSGVFDKIIVTISGQKAVTPTDPTNPTDPTDPTDPEDPGNHLPVIKGDEVLINEDTDLRLLKGNSYSTLRIMANVPNEYSENYGVTALTNVKADKLIVNGGTKLVLDNCQINYIYVLKPDGEYKITLTNGSTVAVTEVDKAAVLSGTGYGTVNINTTEVITIDSGAVIKTLNITEPISKIALNGTVATVNVAETATNSVFEGNGSITKLITKASIKLGIKNVGTIEGVASYEDLDGLIEEARKLELATKAVVKAESSKSAADIADARKLVGDIADDSVYVAERDKLTYRLNKLETSNDEDALVLIAKKHVIALENAATVDPISKLSDVTTTPASVQIDTDNDGSNDSGLTTGDIYDKAQASVYKLTAGTANRRNLQERIDKVKANMVKEKALENIIVRESQATTPEQITINEYSAAGISSVTSNNLNLANQYVYELGLDESAIFTSQVLSTKTGISSALSGTRTKVQTAVNKAVNVLSAETTAKSNIAKAKEAALALYVSSGSSTLKTATTYDNIKEAKKLYDKATSSINLLKSLDSTYSIDLTDYETARTKLANAATLLAEAKINALFADPSTRTQLSSGVTQEKITEVGTLLTDIQTDFSSIMTNTEYSYLETTLSGYIDDANTLYLDQVARQKQALEALEGAIVVDSSCVSVGGDKTAVVVRDNSGNITSYTLTISTSNSSDKYTVDTGNFIATYIGGTTPITNLFVPVDSAYTASVSSEAAYEAVKLTVSPADYTVSTGNEIYVPIASILKSTDTNGDPVATLSFNTAVSSWSKSIILQKDSYTYNFKATMTVQNTGGNFVATVSIKPEW